MTKRSNAELHIAAVIQRYQQSTMRLGLFVSEVQRGLTRAKDLQTGLLTKLRRAEEAAERGEVPTDPPPPDSVPLVLERDEFDLLTEAMEEAMDAMDHFPGMLVEMAFINLIAAFEAFLADLLRAVLVHRPEMLKSEKRVTFEEVIAAESKDDLVGYLADKEIGSLTYSSFRKQISYIEERFGLDLQLSPEDLDKLVEAHARRNVLLHNAGVVNQQFMDLVPQAQFTLGAPMRIDLPYWESIRASLDELASSLENGILARFFKADFDGRVPALGGAP